MFDQLDITKSNTIDCALLRDELMRVMNVYHKKEKDSPINHKGFGALSFKFETGSPVGGVNNARQLD